MTYYHATYAARIPSILRHGLRTGEERNFADADEGVYLSTDPVLPVGFLIEHILSEERPDLTPRGFVESLRVIVIDPSRIDASLLRPDPHTDGYEGMFWLYEGVVDVTNMPILTTDDLSFAPGWD